MPLIRVIAPLFAFRVGSLFALVVGAAAQPEYKLGDVATENVVTPVAMLVVNPEATEALRQKVAQQVQPIVRFTPKSAVEAEQELRAQIAGTKATFLDVLRGALQGRPPAESDLGSAIFPATVQVVGREAPKGLPVEKLAPLWVRGEGEEAVIASLLRPLREVMVQPINIGRADSALPANQLVRLIPVKGPDEMPSALELESAGQAIASGKVISLWRAKRLVETHFPAGQEDLGRFAASFVRANAYPDAALTEVLRSKRREGVTVNDTYEAAQMIVRKGQTIDRKALSALAVMREKSLIGTLQTKIEQEKSVSNQISEQTKWLIGGLGGLGLVLVLIFWRLRGRPSAALVPTGTDPRLPGDDFRALPEGERDEAWRDRAIVAEGKAKRAQEAIRSGALGWMKDKVFQTLAHQRGELLSTQQRAEAEMRELEQRLEQLRTPLQERIQAYEHRIEELEQELLAKGEENRELIGARISVAKSQLNVVRERGRFESN